MGSGRNGRNQHSSNISCAMEVKPQWGPAVTAGIRDSWSVDGRGETKPQWGPAVTAGIRYSPSTQLARQRQASMGSGRNGRNQLVAPPSCPLTRPSPQWGPAVTAGISQPRVVVFEPYTLASMGSGRNGRNQALIMPVPLCTLLVPPQWGPAVTAGIRIINPPATNTTIVKPQWGPAVTAGIRRRIMSPVITRYFGGLNGVRP